MDDEFVTSSSDVDAEPVPLVSAEEIEESDGVFVPIEPEPEPEPKPLPHQAPGVTAAMFLVARKIPPRRWGGFRYWAQKNHPNARHPIAKWMELFEQYGKTPIK